MKKRSSFKKSATLLLAASLLLTSCAKSEKDPEEDPSPTPIDLGEFNYTPGSGTSVTADSSICFPAFNNIVSYKSGATQIVDISLSALSVGTYDIAPSLGISLTYTSGSTVYNADSGAVRITANTGSKLSGNFGVRLKGGTLKNLSGNFSDVPKR